MNCYHCGATTDNGLALCEQCRITASVYLEWIPPYFKNLARWRPGHAGSRPVPASREPKDFRPRVGDAVERALDDAGAVLVSWARNLEDDRGVTLPDADGEAETVVALCRSFAENLTTVATLEWCGEFVRELGEHEATLRALTERVAPGWYAGGCRVCDAPTYVVPGLTWVTCGGCGSTTYARDHLDGIIDEAREWVATPIKLAGFLVAMFDQHTSVEDVRKRIATWGNRGHYDCIRESDYAVKHYRLGDVLDRMDRDARQAAA